MSPRTAEAKAAVSAAGHVMRDAQLCGTYSDTSDAMARYAASPAMNPMVAASARMETEQPPSA